VKCIEPCKSIRATVAKEVAQGMGTEETTATRKTCLLLSRHAHGDNSSDKLAIGSEIKRLMKQVSFLRMGD